MEIIEVEYERTEEVVQGDTWIEVCIEADDGKDYYYSIDIAWTKYPEEYHFRDAQVAKVFEETKGSSGKWYHNEDWLNIPGWDEIEEAAMEKFEEEML